MNYQNQSDAISTVAHPQLSVIAKLDKSTKKQEKPYYTLSRVAIRSSNLQVDKRGHYNDQIYQYESISHYENVATSL